MSVKALSRAADPDLPAGLEDLRPLAQKLARPWVARAIEALGEALSDARSSPTTRTRAATVLLAYSIGGVVAVQQSSTENVNETRDAE